jgi:hypothetical protein
MDMGWRSLDKSDEMQSRESESAAMALYVGVKTKIPNC